MIRFGGKIFILVIFLLAACLGACGGGGGGGEKHDQEVLELITIEPPSGVSMTFDDRSFVEVASEGDEAAVAASVQLVLASTQVFAVVRDGEQALLPAAGSAVGTSALEIDVDRFRTDYQPESNGDGLFGDQFGAWVVEVDLPGSGALNFFVQFEDAAKPGEETGVVTKNFGSTTTDKITVATERSEISFFDADLLEIDDARWVISGIRGEGDIVTVDAHGTVTLDFELPVVGESDFDFEVVGLRLDFTSVDSFRRPEAGRIALDFDDVVPVIDQDLDVSIEFFGDHDALVVIDGGICDFEIEWDLSSSLPEDVELRDCF